MLCSHEEPAACHLPACQTELTRIMESIDLWNPIHPGVAATLVTALLLGLVHGMVPDEHTWPITFSYAVGGYSTRKGLRGGRGTGHFFTQTRALRAANPGG